MGSKKRKELTKLEKYIKDYIDRLLKLLPKLNNRTGKRPVLNKEQHPDFIYPVPNPTIVYGDSSSIDIRKLDPEAFDLIGSKIILFGPDIYWNGLVQVCCPLCKQPAASHGWCKTLRRVKTLHHTYYLVGRRYKCVNCPSKWWISVHNYCSLLAVQVTCSLPL